MSRRPLTYDYHVYVVDTQAQFDEIFEHLNDWEHVQAHLMQDYVNAVSASRRRAVWKDNDVVLIYIRDCLPEQYKRVSTSRLVTKQLRPDLVMYIFDDTVSEDQARFMRSLAPLVGRSGLSIEFWVPAMDGLCEELNEMKQRLAKQGVHKRDLLRVYGLPIWDVCSASDEEGSEARE